MKKLLLLFALVALPVASFAKFSGGDGHTVDFSKYKRMMVSVKKQVREVRSDYSLPGYVIHYYSDGSVETNAIVHIDLKIQTNTVEKQIEDMSATIARQFVAITNQMAQTASWSNAYVIVSATAAAATAKIQDEIADLEAKIVKYKEYQTKYPLVKSLFAAMIADAENRIKILQALTGGQ